MSGKTRQYRIRNGTIRERVGVALIVEKLVENRLRWFGHLERWPVDAVVRRVDQMEESQVKRGRWQPRKTNRETIRNDLEVNELDPNILYDRTLWRIRMIAYDFGTFVMFYIFESVILVFLKYLRNQKWGILKYLSIEISSETTKNPGFKRRVKWV